MENYAVDKICIFFMFPIGKLLKLRTSFLSILFCVKVGWITPKFFLLHGMKRCLKFPSQIRSPFRFRLLR